MVQSPETAPVAIGGAPPGDPCWCLLSVAHSRSWAMAGGRQTWDQAPRLRSCEAAVRAKAKLVWVSISVESPEANIRQGLEMLSETMLGMNGSVVVGGESCPKS